MRHSMRVLTGLVPRRGGLASDQASEGLLSPYLQRRRVRAVLPYVSGTVLDYGCGSGALAAHVLAADYVGVDVDEPSLIVARTHHRGHRFMSELPPGVCFDTAVAAAVIEHVADPVAFLARLASVLKPTGSIVLTTPHPRAETLHQLGARIGLFSSHADEEHEQLLDHSAIVQAAAGAALRLEHFQRFQLGLNQLAILRPAVAAP